VNPKLTARDVSIILDVYKYRYLSVSQVERLYFPSKRTAWRRLQALTILKYLKAFSVPHIPERIYYLDKAGAEIVASEMQVTVADLQWYPYTRAPKDYYFLRHFLAINDFRILVALACQDSQIRLLGFIPEYVGEKTRQGNVKKYIRDRVCDVTNEAYYHSHTPDGVFALEKDGKPALFFLEIDRGTEIISDPEKGFLKCIVFYLNYWTEKKFARYAEDFNSPPFQTFHVLFITTSGERIKHIRAAVTALPYPNDSIKRFFWITTEARIHRDGVFGTIWVSSHREDQNLHRIG
jgi:hypothetical protein